MATIKKSTTKAAAPKKAAPKIVIKPEPAQEASTLTKTDLAMIAEIAAIAAAEAVKAAMVSSTSTPASGSIASMPLTPEAIALMSDEDIKAFNDGEARKAAARKAAQEANKAKYENMSTGDRERALLNIRDPEVIRVATPPGWAGEPGDLVRVICKRRIGLSGGEISDLDEVIDMPRENAKAMQKNGVIEVQI